MVQERRQELWDRMVDEAAAVCDRFAWAIPDERALRILGHFEPIVEVAAGAGVALLAVLPLVVRPSLPRWGSLLRLCLLPCASACCACACRACCARYSNHCGDLQAIGRSA